MPFRGNGVAHGSRDWAKRQIVSTETPALIIAAVAGASAIVGFALNRERARLKEQKLILNCAPDIGTMYADERRLKQVLFNLTSNVIKFTPEQGVISLGTERDGGDVDMTLAPNEGMAIICRLPVKPRSETDAKADSET